jgi:steroid 5-alpha reductase family enzyme
MWWGISLSVVCAIPERWYLIAGAFINTCLFLFISIPMADNRQSQKQGFDEYKKQTRMLLPIKK